jgi:putative ABC transport system substrate-binding protein
MTPHRDLVITLAARYRLPAVYSSRSYVAAGGLVSYGPDVTDQYRRAAGYVDRILRGEKPADLPVQQPNKKAARVFRLVAGDQKRVMFAAGGFG